MRGTTRKLDLRDEWNKEVDRSQELTERLFKLVDEKKVTSGCLLVHAWYNLYSYKTLSDIFYKKWKLDGTRVSLLRAFMENFTKDVKELEELVIENENATMEDCQRTRVLREKEERS